MNRIAIIDCGTNTFHLLIVEQSNDVLNTIHVEQRAVKIGRGGINQHMINEAAQHRALEALKGFKQKIIDSNVQNIFAFATSAFRNASNGLDLHARIKKVCSIDIRIIDGAKEAEFIYYGVRSAVDIGGDAALVIDIGGGSVEFIIANNTEILWKQSVEIGAQRLLDLFYENDPITLSEIERLNTYLHERLSDLLNALKRFQPKTMIGSSGTFDTLSTIYCKSNNIEIAHTTTELPLTLTAYQEIHEQILKSSREERLNIPGMSEMRVDMIVVASCIIDFLFSKQDFKNIRVSTYALKEGVLTQIVEGEILD